jgi:hypothetical protein
MKYRAILAALVLSTAVHAAEEEPTTVQISAERLKECAEGGGCAFVTEAEMAAAFARVWDKAYERGKQASYETCGSRTKAWE